MVLVVGDHVTMFIISLIIATDNIYCYTAPIFRPEFAANAPYLEKNPITGIKVTIFGKI